VQSALLRLYRSQDCNNKNLLAGGWLATGSLFIKEAKNATAAAPFNGASRRIGGVESPDELYGVDAKGFGQLHKLHHVQSPLPLLDLRDESLVDAQRVRDILLGHPGLTPCLFKQALKGLVPSG
jgi:hypothetical protein